MSGLIASLKTGKPESSPKTLIFCQTKEAVVKVYRLLLHSAKSRESVSMFHASLTKTTKQAIQQEFQSPSSALRCLVATVAFGMVGTPLSSTALLLYTHHYVRCHRGWIFLI